jgi:hypothetical protein
MKKKWSAGSRVRLTGFAVALLILMVHQAAQGQNASVAPSFVADSDNAIFYAFTYAGNRPGSLTPAGLTMISGKSAKGCEPHLGMGLGQHRPRNPKQPRKANSGKRNSGIPCEQQPIVKLRRHRGAGRRV